MEQQHSTISGLKIAGHRGTWHEISRAVDADPATAGILLLMEHDEYGQEAPCLIIKATTHEIVLDDVHNGWDDYEEAFEDCELNIEYDFEDEGEDSNG